VAAVALKEGLDSWRGEACCDDCVGCVEDPR